MIDWFVSLTPLLLLPLVMLLVFVGCHFVVPGVTIGAPFGDQPNDIPLQGDYYGDGKTEAAFYRPMDQTWHIWNGDVFTGPGSEISFRIGQAGDIPVPGDYGAGHTQPAVFRPSTAEWIVSDLNGTTVKQIQFGQGSNVPVPANYLVDGRRTILDVTSDTPVTPGNYIGDSGKYLAIFRQGDSLWHIADLSGQEVKTLPSNGLVSTGDVLVPGDYDGKGTTKLATFKAPAIFKGTDKVEGLWSVFSLDGTVQPIVVGKPGDIPLRPAIYVGSQTRVITTFRKGTWYFADIGGVDKGAFNFGQDGELPVPGNYYGDGVRYAIYNRFWWITPKIEVGIVKGGQ